MQKYIKILITAAFLLMLANESTSQANKNQLVIIKKASKYKAFLKENPGKGLLPVKKYIQPSSGYFYYATRQNFTGKQLYKKPELYLVSDAVERLQKVQDSLKAHNLCLFFYDGYRPYDVTVKMWKVVPDERYAANPARGSGHNRGIAVDLTLANLTTGDTLAMPTGYDNFSDTAHHSFLNLPEDVLNNRSLLKGVMEHFGFRALSTEWWHYSLPNSQEYPLLDLSFKKLKRMKPEQFKH